MPREKTNHEKPSLRQTQVYEDFLLKRKRMKKASWIIFLSAVFVITTLALTPWEENNLHWLVIPGAIVLIIFGIVANLDWSCPACGKMFRKISASRIRFCPYCGITLVEGACSLELSPGDSMGEDVEPKTESD